MQRYLRPDLMAAAGVEHFDDWAATFGQTVTEIEMAPTGGGNYRMNTRFARFQNVPEMLRMWHVFADVKTAEDLSLPTPELKPHQAEDGAERRAPKTVVIPAGLEITAYLRELADRAEKVRGRGVDPSEDNMLKISGDGRRAALDMRLVSGRRTAGECKLERATTVIARLWRENRGNTYLDPDSGQPSPTPGGLQIVFCDLSTPAERWNAYAELRALLAAEGVPEQQIRFVHEARNDAEKGRLFAACRAGHVAVLIGSTEKMGVGTNIQTRAVALHHLDCPWRPADIEQREGRILRQGNQNPRVEIYRYVVERSFDAYSWQTVERKAKFIAQVTRGRLDVRSIEDIGDQALSYTEVKALASGDPLILEHARVSNEVTRLERLERAWVKNREQLRYTLASAVEREKARGYDVEAIERAIARRVDTRGEKFAMTIGAVHYTERTAAAEALIRWAQTAPLGRTGADRAARRLPGQRGRQGRLRQRRPRGAPRPGGSPGGVGARHAQASGREPAHAAAPARAPDRRPRAAAHPHDRQPPAGRPGHSPRPRGAGAAVQVRRGTAGPPRRAGDDHRADACRGAVRAGLGGHVGAGRARPGRHVGSRRRRRARRHVAARAAPAARQVAWARARGGPLPRRGRGRPCRPLPRLTAILRPAGWSSRCGQRRTLRQITNSFVWGSRSGAAGGVRGCGVRVWAFVSLVVAVWVSFSGRGLLAVAGGVADRCRCARGGGSGEGGERADACERVVEVLLPGPAGGHPECPLPGGACSRPGIRNSLRGGWRRSGCGRGAGRSGWSTARGCARARRSPSRRCWRRTGRRGSAEALGL